MLEVSQINQLANLLTKAHYDAALQNDNISSCLVVNAYKGSRNRTQAIIAGVACMGGDHAPLAGARHLLKRYQKSSQEDFNLHISNILINQKKVPGFGNSFWKDRIDPCFLEVYNLYCDLVGGNNPIIAIGSLIQIWHEGQDKYIQLFPNAAIITGAACDLMGLEPGMELGVALQGRIPAWIKLMNATE